MKKAAPACKGIAFFIGLAFYFFSRLKKELISMDDLLMIAVKHWR